MSSIRHLGSVLIALLAFVATVPGLARATTYCVHQPGGTCAPGAIDKAANLQGALNDALAHAGVDDVLVGAGEYTGPFAYSGLAAVNIRGVGDATVLRTANANGTTVLNLFSAASTVSDLRIDAPLGNSSMNNFGLESMGTASGVNVVIPPNPTFSTVGVVLRGGTFRGGSVTGPTKAFSGFSVAALATDPSGHALVEDARLQAFEALEAAGAATIRRVDAVARTGFSLQSENPAGGSFLLEDSVWRTPPGATEGVGIQAGCGSNVDLQLTARNLTLVNGATGPDFNYTVAAICNLVGRSVAIDLSSSILVGGVWSLRALANAGPATIDVAYSDFDPTTTELVGAAAAITTGPGNVNVAPGFAGPNDFHLLRGSPLIDAGDPAPLTAGESATDLDGAPRIADSNGLGLARRDIGAFELQPLPPGSQPVPPGPQPPGLGPQPDTLAPVLGRLRVEPRRFRVAAPAKRSANAATGTMIGFRLSESATVRLRIQRALPGGARGAAVASRRRNSGARAAAPAIATWGPITRRDRPQGANAVAFSGRFGRRALRPGPYRVLADATDPTGNRSRSRAAPFRVLKPQRR